MPAKRPGDEDVAAPIAAKALRNDLAPPQEHDVQAGARRKGASNRTGQACDRCKVGGHLQQHPLTPSPRLWLTARVRDTG